MAGSPSSLEWGWNAIRKHVEIEKPGDINLYLGCKHERSSIKMPDGTQVNVVQYNQEEYIDSALEKYIQLASHLEGKPVQYKQAWTPTLPEDQNKSPMGAPAATGPCHTCPWCKFAFPQDTGVSPDTGGTSKRTPITASMVDPRPR